jgi:coenzyme F420-0:L-glutamate ligase/coenzyme F420-1:gamma-L-glutamate ligase
VIRIVPLTGLPEAEPGLDLAQAILQSVGAAGERLAAGDVLVVTSKLVSKSEGRLVSLEDVTPSAFATAYAAEHGKDPRHVEVVLGETRRIVRMDRGVLIAETHHGFVCANAGVDASNAGAQERLVLLPLDSDASARSLRAAFKERAGVDVAVVISDTFGRAWRTGQTNIAIGCAGIGALRGYHGEVDPEGRTLVTTSIAVVDELAGAAELVMGKLDRVPVALVRGYPYPDLPADEPDPGVAPLIRQAAFDLFR